MAKVLKVRNSSNTAWETIAVDVPDMTGYASETYVDNAVSGKLDSSTAATLYEKLIPYSSSAPSTPSAGDMWIDSSGSSPLLKAYNGSTWVQLGSSDDVVMRLNLQTISSNYTIPSGYNGVTAGPITIANGVTVTVPSGSSWSIV